MPKLRNFSAGVLYAAALSLAGVLVGPAVAYAAPGQPVAPMHPGGTTMGPMHPGGPGGAGGAGMRPEPPPTHPIYHYSDDLTHPVWSVTHPVSALLP